MAITSLRSIRLRVTLDILLARKLTIHDIARRSRISPPELWRLVEYGSPLSADEAQRLCELADQVLKQPTPRRLSLPEGPAPIRNRDRSSPPAGLALAV